MKKHTRETLEFFTFDTFSRYDNVTCFVTTRSGGFSRGDLEGLNLGMRCGDDPDTVIDNRAQLSLITGAFPDLLTFGCQVHGNNVSRVTGDQIGSGSLDAESAIADTDAMVTDLNDVPLVVLIADCAVVALFDPEKRAVGLAHAGWRGAVAGIAAATVQKMEDEFGSRPADIVAGIGPSIGPCCFEVGDEVAERFVEAFPGSQKRVVESRSGKAHVNLWEANRQQLSAAGLRDGNIETADLCTSCRTDLFYSHRKEAPKAESGKSGRFAGVILLNDRTRRAR
jgi:YfiH family protein